jgi:signal transduction histidine kinase
MRQAAMATDDSRGTALPPMRVARAREILGRTRTSVDGQPAEVLAARASVLASPVILLAPTPAGRRRLARAMHAIGERPGLLVTAEIAEGSVPASASTLLVEVDAWDRDLEAAVEGVVDDGDPWLLLAAGSLDDLPAPIRLSLGAPLVEQPSLDADALAPAAEAALLALARPLGESPVLEPDALAWLAACPASRDRDALEGLLRRALVQAAPGQVIGVGHLPAVDSDTGRSGEPTAGEASGGDAAPVPSERLEYVLAELAHELRNPLVTLKTVADHLGELAEDAELRERFGHLAADAVRRMDDLLDNLVTYGRLGAPARRPLEVAGLLDAAVRDAEPALAERRLSVRAVAGSAACLSDPAHLGFALKNLLVGIAQTAAPDGDVLVDADMNGVVRVRFTSDADAATLRRLLAPPAAQTLYDPTFQPLPFSLARAVLESVGGRVDVASAGDGGTALEVHLPVPDRAE